MAWFKVDDRLWAHPKIINLPLTALGLWVKAGSYCAQFETDGALETHMIRTLGAQKRDADRLVNAGLWKQTETGYVFHNWDEFQPTKAQKDAERAATKERVSKWRNGRRNGVTNGVSNGGGNGGGTDAPTRPDPTRKKTTTNVVAKENAKEPKTRRSTQLPKDWKPTDTHEVFALENDLSMSMEAESFRNNALAKGLTYKDWDAAFRNWLLNAVRFREQRRPKPVRQESAPWDGVLSNGNSF